MSTAFRDQEDAIDAFLVFQAVLQAHVLHVLQALCKILCRPFKIGPKTSCPQLHMHCMWCKSCAR